MIPIQSTYPSSATAYHRPLTHHSPTRGYMASHSRPAALISHTPCGDPGAIKPCSRRSLRAHATALAQRVSLGLLGSGSWSYALRSSAAAGCGATIRGQSRCRTIRIASIRHGFRCRYSAMRHPRSAGRQTPPDSSARC